MSQESVSEVEDVIGEERFHLACACTQAKQTLNSASSLKSHLGRHLSHYVIRRLLTVCNLQINCQKHCLKEDPLAVLPPCSKILSVCLWSQCFTLHILSSS